MSNVQSLHCEMHEFVCYSVFFCDLVCVCTFYVKNDFCILHSLLINHPAIKPLVAAVYLEARIAI